MHNLHEREGPKEQPDGPLMLVSVFFKELESVRWPFGEIFGKFCEGSKKPVSNWRSW